MDLPGSCRRTTVVAALVILSLTGSTLRASAQGSLTPPGPPGPTMKTLAQVEARTAISALPFTISGSGSYYLTASLTAPSASGGIIVNASNVSIDLNGFALIGQGAATSGADGIHVSASMQNVTVSNGSIRHFPGSGIGGEASSSRFEKLTISDNLATGITVAGDCEIRDCVMTHNGSDGVAGGSGCRVVQSIANENKGSGIFIADEATVESCTASLNTVDGIFVRFGGTVQGCVARFNGDNGISFGGGNLIMGNVCDRNTFNGFFTQGDANRIDSNASTYNSLVGVLSGGSRNIIVRNSARGNTFNAFGPSSDDVYGQIVDLHAAGGQIPTTASAWANISY